MHESAEESVRRRRDAVHRPSAGRRALSGDDESVDDLWEDDADDEQHHHALDEAEAGVDVEREEEHDRDHGEHGDHPGSSIEQRVGGH